METEQPSSAGFTEIEMAMEVDASTAMQMTKGQNALFLDIREPDEAQICQIKDSLFIPMNEVPERLEAIPTDRPVIVYCHYGMRSMRVVKYLRSAGISNCTSLKGGISCWADVCEPDMARY